ncbi:MAG: hypothetical protein L0Y66_05990 [Myxococcaceae bacterium]|nr:hypothetical protein [Myxococcaceae bacterium]
MRALPLLLVSSLGVLSACSIVVDVQTDPVDQAIPMTSIQTKVYGEVAVDIPAEARGDIVEITRLALEAVMVNPAAHSDLEFELLLSTEGQATPDQPSVYPGALAPAYVKRATVLVPVTTVRHGESLRVDIPNEQSNEQLLEAVTTAPRIWLIAANTLKPLSPLDPDFGVDPLPLELRLEDIVVKAQVLKSFEGASGAQGALGL